ncbi:MAG: hypothetical protein QXK47_03105 [Candidatus Bathyarchaeia archaeon]
MKSKMIGLFVVVMTALIVAGFAYAHWTETLVLEGTVETGELDLTWSCECWDNDDELKDVGDVECNITGDTLTITISNVYPCYEVMGTIDINNTGTVPAVLVKFHMALPENVILKDLGGYNYELYYDADKDGEPDLEELMATASLTIQGDIKQIDKEETVYISFNVHFTNPGLPENWSGTFEISLGFVNWTPPTT